MCSFTCLPTPVKLKPYNSSTGSTKARRYPLSYILSGRYDWISGNLLDQGTVGHWWSAAANSSTRAYNLIMNSLDLDSQDYANKAHGWSLRILRNSNTTDGKPAVLAVVVLGIDTATTKVQKTRGVAIAAAPPTMLLTFDISVI